MTHVLNDNKSKYKFYKKNLCTMRIKLPRVKPCAIELSLWKAEIIDPVCDAPCTASSISWKETKQTNVKEWQHFMVEIILIMIRLVLQAYHTWIMLEQGCQLILYFSVFKTF